MADIYSTHAKIINHKAFAGKQWILTLLAPDIANNAKPGQFVHLSCGAELLLRRPFSIFTINKKNGCIDLLYKVVGNGTELLAQAKLGQELAVIGPIGNYFITGRSKPLLLGGGVGIPPVIALAQTLKHDTNYQPMAILASEVPFPFDLVDNQQSLLHPDNSKTFGLLAKWNINCALTSLQGFSGVYQGYITDLAEHYLHDLTTNELQNIDIFACGPTPMLQAVAQLAQKYRLPAQLSLEEYMACAVGGCAGCTIKIIKNNQLSMQRACVDGPVFDAQSVVF